MNQFFEIVKIILPVIVSGVSTYVVTKNNNRPTDKIEIAYNRIYHPLVLQMERFKDEDDYENLVNEVKKILVKYKKYASKTTIKACILLEENLDNKKNARHFYQLLEDDIYKYNSQFRRKLGYPEPFLFSIFKYLSLQKKAELLFYLCIFVTMVSIYGFGVFISIPLISIIFFYFFIISIFGAVLLGVYILYCKGKPFVVKFIQKQRHKKIHK